MATQAQVAPFRSAAARHRTTSYFVNYTQGLPLQIPLNRQGYLANLKIKFEGTATVGTAGTAPDPYTTINFFPLIAIRSPQGDYLVSASSRSVYNFQHRLHPAVLDTLPNGQTQVGLGRPQASTFTPGTASAQPIDISYEVPLAMNIGQNFETGLVLAQIANNDFYLQLNCAGPTDLIGTGTAVVTTITGTVYIETTWFELVDPSQVDAPDIHSICRLRDSVFNPLVIGDNYIAYQLGPVLMDEMLLLVLNNQGDTSNGASVNYIKLLANRQVELENRRGKDILRDQFLDLQKQLPPGVYLLNFMDDYDVVNVTRARDFINSNLAAQLDTVVNIPQGTTLNNAQATSIYRELITLGA